MAENVLRLENVTMQFGGVVARLVLADGDIESSGSGWRLTGRNHQIRTAFTHWRDIVSYEHYNDWTFRINGGIFPITDFFTE